MTPTPEQIKEWMESQGFKYHVDVLNHFWEKGNFRDKDYIKVADNAASFFYTACHPEPVVDGGDEELENVLNSFHDKCLDSHGVEEPKTKSLSGMVDCRGIVDEAKSVLSAREQRLVREADTKARIDELETAIKMTRQQFDPSSPFANITNINNQVIAATSLYLSTRLAQLLPKHKDSKS